MRASFGSNRFCTRVLLMFISTSVLALEPSFVSTIQQLIDIDWWRIASK